MMWSLARAALRFAVKSEASMLKSEYQSSFSTSSVRPAMRTSCRVFKCVANCSGFPLTVATGP